MVYLSDDRTAPLRGIGLRAIIYGCCIAAFSLPLTGTVRASSPGVICDTVPVVAQPTAIPVTRPIAMHRKPAHRPVGIAVTAHPAHHHAPAARRPPMGLLYSTSCHSVALVGSFGAVGFGLPRGFPGALGGPAPSYAGSMSPVPGTLIGSGFPSGGFSPAPIPSAGSGVPSPKTNAHAPMPPIPIGPEQSLYPPLLPVSFMLPPASNFPGGQVPPGLNQPSSDVSPPDTAPPTGTPPSDTSPPVMTSPPGTPVPEPSAVAIFLLGVASIIAFRCWLRRKRRFGIAAADRDGAAND